MRAGGKRTDTYFVGRIEFTCPSCGGTAHVPPAVWLNQRTRLRPSDLPTAMLESLLEALTSGAIPKDVTPEGLRDRFPEATPIIAVAVQRGGRNWLALLALIVTLIIGYLAHSDAQEAHTDAQKMIDIAGHAAKHQTEQTVHFSEQEIEHIVSEAVTKLQERRQKQRG